MSSVFSTNNHGNNKSNGNGKHKQQQSFKSKNTFNEGKNTLTSQQTYFETERNKHLAQPLNQKCDPEFQKLIDFISNSYSDESVLQQLKESKALNLASSVLPDTIHISAIQDFSYLFVNALYDLSFVETIDITGWDTSKATNFTHMFAFLTNLKRVIGIESLNVSNVLSFDGMFFFCKSLRAMDLSNWKLTSAMNINQMFSNTGLKSLKVNNWNLPNLVHASQTFAYCHDMYNLNISGWRAPKLAHTYRMLYSTEKLKNLNMLKFSAPCILSTDKPDSIKDMFALCLAFEEHRHNHPVLSYTFDYNAAQTKLDSTTSFFVAPYGFKEFADFLEYKTKYDIIFKDSGSASSASSTRPDSPSSSSPTVSVEEFDLIKDQIQSFETRLQKIQQEQQKIIPAPAAPPVQEQTITTAPIQLINLLAEKVSTEMFNNKILELSSGINRANDNISMNVETLRTQIQKDVSTVSATLSKDIESLKDQLNKSVKQLTSDSEKSLASCKSEILSKVSNFQSSLDSTSSTASSAYSKAYSNQLSINSLTKDLKSFTTKHDNEIAELKAEIQKLKALIVNQDKLIQTLNGYHTKRIKAVKSLLIDMGAE